MDAQLGVIRQQVHETLTEHEEYPDSAGACGNSGGAAVATVGACSDVCAKKSASRTLNTLVSNPTVKVKTDSGTIHIIFKQSQLNVAAEY